MKSWLNEWPVWCAIIVGFLNMELVVIPFILKGWLGLTGSSLNWAAAVCSTAELSFWTPFAFWVIKKTKTHEQVNEVIVVSKVAGPRLKEVVKKTGYVHWAESWVEDNLVSRFSPKSQERVIAWLKRLGIFLGWLVVLFLGSIPVFWIGALIFCCLRRWWWGFVALFTGNIIKNVSFAWMWDFIWTIF